MTAQEADKKRWGAHDLSTISFSEGKDDVRNIEMLNLFMDFYG